MLSVEFKASTVESDLPYQFPPQREIDAIATDVENIKQNIGFNDRLRNRMIEVLQKFGFTDSAGLRSASDGLILMIEEFINPEIQRIILHDKLIVAHHPYYNKPSVRKLRPQIERYTSVSLFERGNGNEQFVEDAKEICNQIYNQPKVTNIKYICIVNLLEFFFDCQCKYLIEPDCQKKLIKSFSENRP